MRFVRTAAAAKLHPPLIRHVGIRNIPLRSSNCMSRCCSNIFITAGYAANPGNCDGFTYLCRPMPRRVDTLRTNRIIGRELPGSRLLSKVAPVLRAQKQASERVSGGAPETAQHELAASRRGSTIFDPSRCASVDTGARAAGPSGGQANRIRRGRFRCGTAG